MGLIDVVIESSLQAYDVQALIPIVEAAGGVITTWTGARCDEGGSVVACGDPSLHPELLRLLADTPALTSAAGRCADRFVRHGRPGGGSCRLALWSRGACPRGVARGPRSASGAMCLALAGPVV